MATLQTVSISLAKIKVRWEEPYSSEALNKALSAIPRGIYRGGYLVPTSPASTSFKLVPDDGTGWWSDTFFAVRDKANGFLLTVRESDEITFDMSSQFPLSGAKSWVVVGEIAYTVSGATVGNYKVIDAADFTDDDGRVKLGEVTLVGTETEIDVANLSIVNRNEPVADKNETISSFDPDLQQFFGLLSSLEAWRVPSLDQKKAMNAASPVPTSSNPFVTKEATLDKMFAEPSIINKVLSGTKVKLTGKTVYVGKGAAGTAQEYFSLRDNTNIDNILRVDNNFLEVVAIYNSSDSAELIPSSDADADGFYAEPWVYFNASYTGSLNVACFEKKNYSTISGLASQLVSTLLKFNVNKMESIDPDNPPANYKLLWRSHNALADSNVTKETSSIYLIGGSYGGLVFIVGGYIDNSGNVYAGTGTDSDNVIALLLRGGTSLGGIRLLVKEGPVAGSDWVLSSNIEWSHSVDLDKDDFAVDADLTLMDLNKIVANPGVAGGSQEMHPIWSSIQLLSDCYIRSYVGKANGTYDESCFWITQNAYWDSSSHTWKRDDSGLSSYGLCIGVSGIFLCYQEDDDEWNYIWPSSLAWGKSTTSPIGGHEVAYACFTNVGQVYERILFHHLADNPTSANYTSKVHLRSEHQYRNKWYVAPTQGTPQEVYDSGMSVAVAAYGAAMQNWGCYTIAETDSAALPSGNSVEIYGYVEVYG